VETKAERRASTRKPIRFPIRYSYLPPEADPPDNRTLDLSVEGACIETLKPFQKGASVAFFIVTPENQVIITRARVVHLQRAGYPPYRAGVRFTHLSPAERAALQNAIEHAAA